MKGQGGIRVRTGGTQWSAPESAAYEDESHLQRLISEEPGWVPGVGGGALAVEELPTTGGPVDVCIVGQDGALTVVECKLASSRERRRMVIGQVIDYAAAIWMEGPAAFHQAWTSRFGDELLSVLEDTAVAALDESIRDGRIDLCLAVDEIDDDLQRLVEYLNQVTMAEVRVSALQLAYVKHGDTEILIPSTFGGEIAEAKVRTSTRNGEKWTQQSFLEALGTEADRDLARKLFKRMEGLEALASEAPLWFGQRPGGGIYLNAYGLHFQPAYLTVNQNKRLMVGGTWKSYADIAHHGAYAPLAALMGQSHLVGSKSIPVASIDFEELWSALLTCALAINADQLDDAQAVVE